MTARARPRLCVLMSLYRGRRYLAEQLGSIAAQTGVDVHLTARDDGSGDGTAEAFRDLARAAGLSFDITEGANVGACGSFFTLIEQAPGGFDAYAFADQDDWWRPDKLQRAAACLASAETPMLYFCGQTIADRDLNPLRDSMAFARIGFGNALVQNVVQGASAVINEAGLRLLQTLGRPDYAYMHDWWLYLVFSSLGTLHYDHYSGMLYRQHDANVVGVEIGRWTRWRERVRRYARSSDIRSRQAACFRKVAGHRLGTDDARLLDTFIAARHSLRARAALAVGDEIWFQHRKDDWLFRVALINGRY